MKLFISKLRTLTVKIVVVFVEYGIIYYSFLNYYSRLQTFYEKNTT